MNEVPVADDSAGSDSESSVNDFSFSNDEMLVGGEGSPAPLTPLSGDGTDCNPGEDGFPVQDFITMMDGLNRLPSWVVYPVHLANCLGSSAKLLHDRVRLPAVEMEMIRRLMREAVPSAFEKCLDDQNLFKWNDDIQLNIFDAVTRLVDLLVVKLSHLKEEECDVDMEEDMLPLLKALALAFDKTSCFHEHHMRDPSPAGTEVDHSFAQPILVLLPEGDRMGTDRQTEEVYMWLATFLNDMAYKHGFDVLSEVGRGTNKFQAFTWLLNTGRPVQPVYMQIAKSAALQALASPEQLSINLIRAFLVPIGNGAEFLTKTALQPFARACRNLLTYISGLLENDIEELSMRGADCSYSAVSQLLGNIFEILSRYATPEEAHRMVGEVQRLFVSKMLGYSNFNKHLSAVRETLRLLKRSQDLKAMDGGSSMKDNLQWLDSSNIIKSMLKGSLHQKQYVDQVQRILQYLLQDGFMTSEHLDLLWGVTEKADTFEAVKSNVYNLLVELAFDFSTEQLDLLFGKFEAAKGRPASDRLKIAQLLCKIAEADKQAIMAERLMGLLWNIVAANDAPTEVVCGGVLAHVAALYEARQQDRPGPSMREVLCLRCLQMVQGEEEDVLRGLFLLRQLVSMRRPSSSSGATVEAEEEAVLKASTDCAVKLLEEHRLSELIVSSMESLSADQLLLPPDAEGKEGKQSPRMKGIMERTQALVFVAKVARRRLWWDVVERLWSCLVSTPVTVKHWSSLARLLGYIAGARGMSNMVSSQDKELGYMMLQEAVPPDMEGAVLDSDSIKQLLTEKFPQQPARDITEAGFSCFECFFYLVGLQEKKLILQGETIVTANLDLTGMQYLWDVATEARCHNVATRASTALLKLHVVCSLQLQEQAISIRRTMIEDILQKLLSAVKVIIETPDVAADDNHIIGRPLPSARVEELLQADFRALRTANMLLDLMERCGSRTQPRLPSHLASYTSSMQRLEVNLPTTPPQRMSIVVSTNDYVGLIRRLVAARISVPADRIRLLSAGHELNNDSKIIRQVGIGDGHVITAAVSDVPNTYSKQLKDGDVDHTPAGILSSHSELYEALLRLADAPHATCDTRHMATILLHSLPTLPVVPKCLLEALLSDEAPAALGQLLANTGAMPSMRRLYFIESLASVLCPTAGGSHLPSGAPPADKLVERVRQTGCLQVLLGTEGVCMDSEINSPTSNPQDRNMLMQTIVLINILIKCIVYPVLRPRKAQQPQRGSNSMGQDDSPAVEAADDAPRPLEVDAQALELVIHHILSQVWIATRIWEPQGAGQEDTTPEGDDADTLMDLEHVAALEALKIFVKVLGTRPEMLSAVVSYPRINDLITCNVFNRRSQRIRSDVVTAFLTTFVASNLPPVPLDQVEGPGKVSPSCWLLRVLIGARSKADQHPKSCLEYFHMMIGCLHNISKPEEVQEAEALLASEILALEGAKPPEVEADARLMGQLRLIQELIRILDRHSSGACNHQGLVKLLICKLLFPEAHILRHVTSSDGDQSLGHPEVADLTNPSRMTAFLHSPCDSQKTRAAALDLLSDVMSGDSASLAEGVTLLMELHYADDPQWDFEYQSSFNRRVHQRYCGLKNAGATCYMNATIQQLFMTSGVRNLLLGAEDTPEDNKVESVLYQLQVTFAHLALSSLDYYAPRPFWRAYKDYDGEPINLREHQDAFEFLTRLQDLVDQQLSDAKQLKVMKSIMGGKFAQQIICRGVSYRSETEQDFMGISVDVRGKRNLVDSLASYVQGELMEGENAYFCEEVGRKVDAVKRACVKTLPNTLVIHLKRFEFDFDTMMRWKIRDRFEFPTNLDMYKYTVEGLAEEEGQEVSQAKRTPDYYQYELVGIVVHSGTAFVGHYYSYIKERSPGLRKGGDGEGCWWSFDDNHVEPWDPSSMDRDCFGGKTTLEVFDNAQQQQVIQEFDRPNSAYLLVYERRQPYEDVHMAAPQVDESVPIDPMEAPVVAMADSSGTEGDLSNKEGAMLSDSTELSANPKRVRLDLPGIGPLSIQSSIYRDVTLDNLRMIDEMHRLEKDYMYFIRHLVEVQSDLSQFEPSQRKLRRTEMSGPKTSGARGSASPVTNSGDSGNVSAPGESVVSPLGAISIELSASTISGQRGEHADQVAVTGMKLAAAFLLKLYLRANFSLRDDMQQWRSVMAHMMEASAPANLTFLQIVSGELTIGNEEKSGPMWMTRYLLLCPSSSVRMFFAQLLACTLRSAINEHGVVVDVGQGDPEPGSMTFAALSVITCLRTLVYELWKSNTLKAPITELALLLQEISLIGPGPTRYLMAMPGLGVCLTELLSRLYQSPHAGLDECIPLFGTLARMMRCSNMFERHQADNPYLLPGLPGRNGQRPSMPQNIAKFVASEKFVDVMTEACLHNGEVVQALQAITWEQRDWSHHVLVMAMDWMAACTSDELIRSVDGIARLVTVQDNYLKARVHLVLNGTDNAGQLPTPLVELVLADGQTQSKRYALLQLLVVISEYSSAELIRDVIHQTEAFKHEWGAVLKWLEDNAVSLPGSQQGTAARGKEAADPASEREELILLKLRELLVQ